MAAPSRLLVALDANVLMDLGAGLELVMDAVETLRSRLPSPRLVIPPTPQQELAFIARHGETGQERERGRGGITAARDWCVVPINLMSAPVIATPAEVVRKFFQR